MISKIVALTDFSAAAKGGVHYAVEFAKYCKAELILLHILPSLGPTLTPVALTRIFENVLVPAEDALKELVREAKTSNLQVRYHIAYNASVEDALKTFTETHSIDLVIMSSKGAAGLKRVLFGSNTVNVINKSYIPVLVIPEHVRVSIPHELIYASDLQNLDNEISLLIPFANALNASIKILHVITNHEQKELDTKAFINKIRQKASDLYS